MASLIVLKCGGSTMEELPDEFFATIAKLKQDGKQVVIVHGGGPAINDLLKKLAIEPQFIDGLRVTCEDTMQAVEMVLAGSINKFLVRRVQQAGGKAWGMSGQDAGVIIAQKTVKPLGLVGEIEQVNKEPILAVLAAGCIPVLAPLGIAADGSTVFNINADVAAGAIAAALSADKLMMITDVPGILETQEDGTKTVKAEADSEEIKQMINSGVIYGGMIPKVTSALDALGQGVKEVVICKGTVEDLLKAFANEKTGTSIKGA
ncbi:acetylglutamate kinase [Brevibacillus fluminis]|uniref:Acetylglutamate kinase n=1 Tax=Brevibacillus fluminis TaxID=511487 RepID=A0A3M8E059_9BACL|nr:acetylglutamate kinase [Brevibacillus fluminis]RNB92627.1 acetylglutamate kinase [Brevibacillus fluminis]